MQGPIVVVGAGIGGISTAFHIAMLGHDDVLICDPRPPLTLTSDKSTECYRNWWPSREMVQLMNRSIDLLERYDGLSGHAFNMNRRGYLYVTAQETQLERLLGDGRLAEAHGAGELRHHTSPHRYRPLDPVGVPGIDGADVLDRDMLDRHFPYLAPHAVGALHARRAGWLSAQQLGAWMLEVAKSKGVRIVATAVDRIDTTGGAVSGVGLADGSHIATTTVVDAAGPMVGPVAELAGVALPVHSEAHFKVAFRDPGQVIPRHAPMVIWCDPQEIPWSDDERHLLADAGRSELIETMPAFCHGRPEGPAESPWFVALWEYHRSVLEPVWPMASDELYPEVVLRGMRTMVPGLGRYLDHMPQPFVDGGYYTKAPDNRPLVGPTAIAGLLVCGALSGFGIMAASAVGDLAARWATGARLPEFAAAFELGRFEDRAYLDSIGDGATGQL